MRFLSSIAVLVALAAACASFPKPAIAASACDADASNLIHDCGFEADTNYLSSKGALYAELGLPWVVSDASDNTVAAPGGNGGVLALFSPHSGKNYLAMGAINGVVGTASQTFADEAGDNLSVGFWLGSDGVVPNQFSVIYDGTTLLDFADLAPQPYTFYSLTVQATGLDTLAFAGASNSPTGFLTLDDITVDPVPEPASLGLLGVGLAACGVIRRRLSV